LSVVDVHADVATAVAVLTDLDRYQERISTVKEAHIIQRGTRKCKARFKLSRFRLEVAVEFAMNRERNMLDFRLDPEATTAAFDQARGFWYVEESPHRPGHSRIFLSAKLVCSPLLPSFIVDYAATKALPKATCWLKPVIEGIARGLPAGAVDVHGVDHRAALLKPTANEAGDRVPAAVHPEWHPPQSVT